MSRLVQMPLSGRDRRAFMRELKRVEEEHKRLVAATAAAYAQAHRTACDEWNARVWLGGDPDPSPRICDAIDAGCVLLEVKCKRCGHADVVDLELVIWPRDWMFHTLARGLECSACRKDGYRKRRPRLIREAAEYIKGLPKSEHDKQHWQVAIGELIGAAERRLPIMHAEIAVNRALHPDDEPRYGAGKAVGPEMKFHRRRKLARDR